MWLRMSATVLSKTYGIAATSMEAITILTPLFLSRVSTLYPDTKYQEAGRVLTPIENKKGEYGSPVKLCV